MGLMMGRAGGYGIAGVGQASCTCSAEIAAGSCSSATMRNAELATMFCTPGPSAVRDIAHPEYMMIGPHIREIVLKLFHRF